MYFFRVVLTWHKNLSIKEAPSLTWKYLFPLLIFSLLTSVQLTSGYMLEILDYPRNQVFGILYTHFIWSSKRLNVIVNMHFFLFLEI